MTAMPPKTLILTRMPPRSFLMTAMPPEITPKYKRICSDLLVLLLVADILPI
jgi:hypothetical protein